MAGIPAPHLDPHEMSKDTVQLSLDYQSRDRFWEIPSPLFSPSCTRGYKSAHYAELYCQLSKDAYVDFLKQFMFVLWY